MTLQEFGDLLLTVTDKVYHFEAFKDASGQYIVWQETGGSAAYGSGRRQNIIKRIQVELYTEDEYDPLLEKLLAVLEEADVAFEEPTTTYDPDTEHIRHIIECEVI